MRARCCPSSRRICAHLPNRGRLSFDEGQLAVDIDARSCIKTSSGTNLSGAIGKKEDEQVFLISARENGNRMIWKRLRFSQSSCRIKQGIYAATVIRDNDEGVAFLRSAILSFALSLLRSLHDVLNDCLARTCTNEC